MMTPNLMQFLAEARQEELRREAKTHRLLKEAVRRSRPGPLDRPLVPSALIRAIRRMLGKAEPTLRGRKASSALR